MKRRTFAKGMFLTSLPFLSFSDNYRSIVNIPISYYISEKVSLSRKNKNNIAVSTENCISTLSTEDIKVTCDVNFEEVNFESSDQEGKREEVKSFNSFKGLQPEIIITDIEEKTYNGRADIGCPLCYENGIIYNGKYLEDFNTIIESNEIIDTNPAERSFMTLIHEVGHNLSFNHKNGYSYIQDDDYIISTIMSGSYVLDDLSCQTNSEGNAFPCHYEDDYYLLKYKFGFNQDILDIHNNGLKFRDINLEKILR